MVILILAGKKKPAPEKYFNTRKEGGAGPGVKLYRAKTYEARTSVLQMHK